MHKIVLPSSTQHYISFKLFSIESIKSSFKLESSSGLETNRMIKTVSITQSRPYSEMLSH